MIISQHIIKSLRRLIRFNLLGIFFLYSCLTIYATSRSRIDLSGTWNYLLPQAPIEIPAEGTINLPSTLDISHKSIYQPVKKDSSEPRREFSYAGNALYSRTITIPESWEGKKIILFLERTKPAVVSVDGIRAAGNSRISSPQRYDLSEVLSPGRHKLEIKVNNADSLPPAVRLNSHAASESTQTNWNGILGEIYLEALPSFHISGVKLWEDHSYKTLRAEVSFSEDAPAGLILRASIDNGAPVSLNIRKGTNTTTLYIPVSNFKWWDVENPELIDINFQIINHEGKAEDNYSISTGLREFKSEGKTFVINDRPEFLRGTVNAAVFPLTGYAPTDKQSWLKYFRILKDYGMNHVRFHSWTPPDAAFEAADEAGIYIQAELPMWGEIDREMIFHDRFLREDLKGIIESYSHHPSFVLFSPGNELWGDLSLMKEYSDLAKEGNPRILSTYGSNVYLGMNGRIGEEDFVVASKTNDDMRNSIRGSLSFADSSTGGHFNSTYPNSSDTFNEAADLINVPLISHEVGQYQSYPDFSEIEKYTGLLKPDNLEELKRHATEGGNIEKSVSFSQTSGQWAAKLYKAEMEMAHRTDGIAGYQIFGLQDYPGQGTALVGILNPFMQSKGFISPEEWKQSNNAAMILAEFPKFSFRSGEQTVIPVLGVNYTSKPDTLSQINWNTGFANGKIFTTGGTGKLHFKEISLKMPVVEKPTRFTLSLNAPAGDITNSYDFIVYPDSKWSSSKIAVTDNLDKALSMASKGGKVILCPDSVTSAATTIAGLFVPDFWNYRLYRTICEEMHLEPSPGTMGLSIDATHPAFSLFPTSNHTDFQWYPIVKNSRPLIIDRLPKEIDPIIEVIDNPERSYRIALLLEANVGKGKIMILLADKNRLEESLEGKWLLRSLQSYMESKEFNPKFTLSEDQILNLITKPTAARKIKELRKEILIK